MEFLIGFLFGVGFGMIGAALLLNAGSKEQYMEGYFDCLKNLTNGHMSTDVNSKEEQNE